MTGQAGTIAGGWIQRYRAARGTARRCLSVSFLALGVLGLAPLGSAAFQPAPADPSPAGELGEVIAQGVIEIPSGSTVWRVVRATAEPPANATTIDTVPGFLLAEDGVVLVETPGADQQDRLAAGEAALTTAGGRQIRAALGPTASSYLAMEMLPADAASSADTLYQSEAFDAPGERHDLDLVAARLAVSEALSIPAGAAPTLVYILSGSAEVATESGEFIPVAQGEAIASPGAITVTAFEGGATVAVAVTGPAVPRLSDDASAPVAATPTATTIVTPIVNRSATPAATRTIATIAAPGAGDSSTAATPAAVVSGVIEAASPVAATPEANSDEDADGLLLVDEQQWNTDPTRPDTDGDGVLDGDEVNLFGSNPLIDDTDGDGIDDGAEVAAGGDPLNAEPAVVATAEPVAPVDAPVEEAVAPVDVPVDAPVDTAPVAEEPVVDGSGALDSDGDGLPDDIEYAVGTDPYVIDTDGDDLGDGDEVNIYATGQLNPDSDGDGVLDGQEVINDTDPNNPNSL